MKSLIILILFIIIFPLGCRNSHQVPAENAGRGELLFNSTGCRQCHSLTGDTSLYGPPLNSIYKKEIIAIRGDRRMNVTIDREYIIRSITEPDFEKVEGYGNKKMPPVNLKQEEIEKIADYLIYINEDPLPKNP